MAQPHEYPGLGGELPGASGAFDSTLIYQESYKPTPFPAPAGEGVSTNAWTPGRVNLFNREITHKVGSDDGCPEGTPGATGYVAGKATIIKSVTPNPPPHIEYGRIGDN